MSEHSIAGVRGLAKNTTNAFRWALVKLGEELRINPDHLAAVMSVETGGTFSPSIVNPKGGATGLIQFMPETAKLYGTTTEALARMTAIEQLQYVRRFFEPWAGRLGSVGAVYMAMFLPVFVGAARDVVVGERDSSEVVSGKLTKGKIYTFNPAFDRDKDGVFTAGDVYQTVERLLPGGERIAVTPEEPSSGGSVLALLAVGGLLYAGSKFL